MKRLAILLLYVYFHPSFCYGQVKALVGSVTDEESGEPVAGAIVQAVDGKSYTFTTNDGRFSLNPNRSLENDKKLFLMNAIRNTALYMLDS